MDLSVLFSKKLNSLLLLRKTNVYKFNCKLLFGWELGISPLFSQFVIFFVVSSFDQNTFKSSFDGSDFRMLLREGHQALTSITPKPSGIHCYQLNVPLQLLLVWLNTNIVLSSYQIPSAI